MAITIAVLTASAIDSETTYAYVQKIDEVEPSTRSPPSPTLPPQRLNAS